MKKLVLFACFAMFLVFSTANSFAAVEYKAPTASEEIHNDDGSLSHIRSQAVESVVRVYKTEAGVQANFLITLGAIDIVVKNTLGGVVYKKTVYAVNGGEVLINTSAWSAGSYIVSIAVPMEDVVSYSTQIN